MDTQDFQDRIERKRERFEEKARRMEERWERRGRHRSGGRIWTGLFILVIGGLLLARQAGVFFPHWFFTWPVFLIGVGLWIGVRHSFRGFGWAIPLVIGGLYLIDDVSVGINLRPYVWPAILILLGLGFIFRPRRRWHGPDDNDTLRYDPMPGATPGSTPAGTPTGNPEFSVDSNDQLDITAVFGGVKKNILTKQFRGGEIMTFMGGAEINLAQADFEGRVKIDCTNVFGGTKLYLPPDWEVQSDIVAIFGGVDDKRPPVTSPAANKLVVLDGTCLFGGVEIRSYY